MIERILTWCTWELEACLLGVCICTDLNVGTLKLFGPFIAFMDEGCEEGTLMFLNWNILEYTKKYYTKGTQRCNG
jgi:hypothetical protein